MIAAPMFHSWGFAHFTLALPLGSTLVLRRRFDPEETLRAVAQHRASALVVVPVMLQRILDLGEETIARYDARALRVIALSGSALPGELATRAMDAFGEVLYNLYGSTEVAWATIATPEDLRAAPGTAGRPPMGTIVKLLDDDGREVQAGESGRIFVANEMMFEGYTDGGGKEIVRGLMSTGDVGRFDQRGAAVRRRPRRRDDRQRRRERVPARGRGPAGRPRGDRGGGGRRRARREVRSAAEGVRGGARRRRAERAGGEGVRQGEPRPLQGAPRGRVPRQAAAQRDRQGAQARAEARAEDLAGGSADAR